MLPSCTNLAFHLFGAALYFILEMLKPVLDGANDKHTPCSFTYNPRTSTIKSHDMLQPNFFLTEETIQDERQFDDPMTIWNIYNLLKRGKHNSI